MDINFLYYKSGKKFAKSPRGTNVLEHPLSLPHNISLAKTRRNPPPNSFRNSLYKIQLKFKMNSKRIHSGTTTVSRWCTSAHSGVPAAVVVWNT
jgi:hypothetical protein